MRRLLAALVLLLTVCPAPVRAYGVLSHEAIIDAVWTTSIVPILRAQYHPSAGALLDAKAFAYGGCLIQDVGYYPFSSRFYGDLTHYVRSGDFIEALVRDARDVNDLAFALGALSHYAADNEGHPIGINVAVSLLYPKLRATYGAKTTYEDDPTAHIRTEFGFDVVQLARHAYPPEAYRSFIGFEIATPLLERAFYDTYGLELKDLFTNFGLAIGTFRWAVGTAIPQMTKVAWDTHQDEIEKLSPSITRNAYLFTMPRATFEAQWGTEYHRPNIWHKFLGLVLRIVPKVGPLRAASFKAPTPEAERLFAQSFEATVARYRSLLAEVAQHPARLQLENRNFDTGRPVVAGDSQLADDAYAELLTRLAQSQFAHVSPALRANVTAFFANGTAEPRDRGDRKKWTKLQRNLAALNDLASQRAR